MCGGREHRHMRTGDPRGRGERGAGRPAADGRQVCSVCMQAGRAGQALAFLASCSMLYPGAGSLGRLSTRAKRSKQFPTAMSMVSPKMRYRRSAYAMTCGRRKQQAGRLAVCGGASARHHRCTVPHTSCSPLHPDPPAPPTARRRNCCHQPHPRPKQPDRSALQRSRVPACCRR